MAEASSDDVGVPSADERLSLMLERLVLYYGLETLAPLVARAIGTISHESLRGLRAKPPADFSDINGNGVPVQFSVSLGGGSPALRFLGEVAGGGAPMARRLALSSLRLRELVHILGYRSASETINLLFANLLPEDPQRVSQWRMGMWFAMSARPGRPIGLRVYLNQRWDNVVNRYHRFARLLAYLGRDNDLHAWCRIAPVVSVAAIPFGVAFDIVPGGVGRLKVYFATQGATRSFWERLLAALGLAHRFALLERFATICGLDLDQMVAGVMSPSLEFTNETSHVGLKVDVSCNQMTTSDRRIDQWLTTYARECGIDDEEYRAVREIVAPGPLHPDRIVSIQYCGVGFQDRDHHRLNVYLCPDLFSRPASETRAVGLTRERARMTTHTLLDILPASLAWAVLFEAAALRRVADDATVRRMFFLPADVDVDALGYIVLTSAGPLVVERTSQTLVDPRTRAPLLAPPPEQSLHHRFREELALLPLGEPACLGIGERLPLPPVALWLRLDGSQGDAVAVFQAEPPKHHFELLRAVGVEFVGSETAGGHHVARFRVNLETHIRAAELGNFGRAGNCTRFFLHQGVVDETVERGLLQAATGRLEEARHRVHAAVAHLAAEAGGPRVTLVCQPPPPAPEYPYGDVVPLGFLLAAMNAQGPAGSTASHGETRARLRSLLETKRRGGLWSYHTGGLVTCTDSVLVLQAFDDQVALESLEVFGDGRGGYRPQRTSTIREVGAMRIVDANRHWCQPDYPTSCLVHGLRRRAGLPDPDRGYVVAGFERRSGLFFANPYMVDWAVASAVTDDGSARELRTTLAAEIVASMNRDYLFGLFDVALSSAFAILALSSLGIRGRPLRLAQLRLLELMEREGTFPPSTPFYSTAAVASPLTGMSGPLPPRVLAVEGRHYALTLYHDPHKVVSTAVAQLALDVDTSSTGAADGDADWRVPGPPHPRYRHLAAADYIREWALPPYVAEPAAPAGIQRAELGV